MPIHIDGIEVQQVWSVRNDPLFDSADSCAAVYKDAVGEHYLAVAHWDGGQHVMHVSAAEADRIIAAQNYRLVFWRYLNEEFEAADRGDRLAAEKLRAAMSLRWEVQ